MIKLENILVATDFGEASQTALTYGRSLARTFGARLHVLHVTHVTQDAIMYTGPESFGVELMPVQARIDADAMPQLDAVVGDDDRRQLGAIVNVRHGNTPAHEIIAYARE